MDSNSIVALSVSISARISPALPFSPSLTCHLASLPSSMVGDSAGIRIWVDISADPRRDALGHLALPVPSVKRLQAHRAYRAGIETAGIDAVAVRMGTRNVERLYAAARAEEVLGRTGVEFVQRERVVAGEKVELLLRYDQMEETAFCADRAIALQHVEIVGREHLEGYRPAVAAAFFPIHGAGDGHGEFTSDTERP